MGKPYLRRPDLVQRLPIRDYMRTAHPTGLEGCVVEDLDVVVRLYGPRFKLDARGNLKLVEHKHPGFDIGTAQAMTFGLMDELMRAGDPYRKRYLGYYVLQAELIDDVPEWSEDELYEMRARHEDELRAMARRHEDELRAMAKQLGVEQIERVPEWPVLVNNRFYLHEGAYKKWVEGELLLPSYFDQEDCKNLKFTLRDILQDCPEEDYVRIFFGDPLLCLRAQLRLEGTRSRIVLDTEPEA